MCFLLAIYVSTGSEESLFVLRCSAERRHAMETKRVALFDR